MKISRLEANKIPLRHMPCLQTKLNGPFQLDCFTLCCFFMM